MKATQKSPESHPKVVPRLSNDLSSSDQHFCLGYASLMTILIHYQDSLFTFIIHIHYWEGEPLYSQKSNPTSFGDIGRRFWLSLTPIFISIAPLAHVIFCRCFFVTGQRLPALHNSSQLISTNCKQISVIRLYT